MSEPTIDGVRDGDLAEILRNFERFWGDRDLRHLHQPMFFCEFADTALVARCGVGRASEIAGYLLGFVAPAGDGYIHLVAVRDDARALGLGRRPYVRFAAVAGRRGATALTALTSPENPKSPKNPKNPKSPKNPKNPKNPKSLKNLKSRGRARARPRRRGPGCGRTGRVRPAAAPQ